MTRKFLHDVVPVVIEWIDANSTAGWDLDHKPTPMRCISAGLLVEDRHDRVILAQSKAGTGDYGDFLEIPRVAVKKLRRLK